MFAVVMKLPRFLGGTADGWCHSVPSLQHNERQKRKARGNMGSKNEAGEKKTHSESLILQGFQGLQGAISIVT